MTARFVSSNTGFNCCCAAACSSARIIPVLDTAINLVVSICVVLLRITTL